MHMNIVDSSIEDVYLDEAVRLTGRCAKTLRRAVQYGQLPRRYVMSPRGPQLVFARAALEQWQRTRRPEADSRRVRRAEAPVDAAMLTRQELMESLSRVARLQATLDENRAAMARLMSGLAQQAATISDAQATIVRLVGRLADVEAGPRQDAASRHVVMPGEES
jgi:hypothetical protein